MDRPAKPIQGPSSPSTEEAAAARAAAGGGWIWPLLAGSGVAIVPCFVAPQLWAASLPHRRIRSCRP